jgi:hypothetical protein
MTSLVFRGGVSSRGVSGAFCGRLLLVKFKTKEKPRNHAMKIQLSVLFTILILLCPFYASSSDFEDESTPIEQEDMKTIDQLNDDSSFGDEPTPIEQDDIKTIEQINAEDSFEDESTSIEQEDIKTIDQINE